MKYDNPPSESELSGASRSPIDVSSKAYRLAGPESIPSAITSVAIATTDPIIEILADYQPEWKRHPDATIVVTTNQVDEPRLLCLSGPEMMVSDERRDSGPVHLEGYREHVRPSSEDPESNGSSEGTDSQSKNNAVSSSTLHEDANTLTWEIKESMKQVDRLGERVDRMTRPKDETPPVLRVASLRSRELGTNDRGK